MADILFDSGETTLKAEYIYLLDKIAELLSAIPNNVRIDGHTDDRPDTDDNDAGNRLSIARASRVCNYVIEEEMLATCPLRGSRIWQVTDHYIRIVMKRNRAKNRRVEIIIKEIPRDV